MLHDPVILRPLDCSHAFWPDRSRPRSIVQVARRGRADTLAGASSFCASGATRSFARSLAATLAPALCRGQSCRPANSLGLTSAPGLASSLCSAGASEPAPSSTPPLGDV
eukprot:4785590-Prymnesium_polylepis.1